MSHKRVLIVDDDPNLVRALTFVLRKEGYVTDTATDGEEAINKTRQHKPDLIFLDVMMPKKNGYEVCQELKNDPYLDDIYIIMLTAKGQDMDRRKARNCGADEFITKPFSPATIVNKVNLYLGKS